MPNMPMYENTNRKQRRQDTSIPKKYADLETPTFNSLFASHVFEANHANTLCMGQKTPPKAEPI